ncbi:hypothetical protein HY571_02025, partial [Candidatus Micrarchaeota archaeon]|nr:hypothetical protein [Candidatus Micrarchaeota archaeon]
SYAVRQTITVGQEIEVGNTGFKVSLTDVYAPSGSTSQPACGLLITAPDGRTVTKNRDKNSASVKISELGNIWVKVGAVGYSAVAGATNTCEVSSFSDAITLRNGTIDESLYPNWKAVVDSNNRSSTQGISEIRVYNDNYAYPQGTRARPGDKFTIISGLTSNTGFEIEFIGADITAVDRDALSIQEYDLSANLPGGQGTGNSLSIHSIRFVSSRSDAFRFGSTNVNTVYYLAKNKTTASQNLTGSWFYQNSSGDWINATDVVHTDGIGTIYTGSPPYYYATGGGSDTNVRFNASINSGNRNITNTFSIGNATHVNISIPEVLNESTSTTAGYWYLYYDYGTVGATDGNFRSAIGGTTNDNMNYTSGAFGVGFNGNMPFYSPRGSFVSSYSSTGVTINYATRLGKAVYKLRQLTGTGSGSSPTVTCNTFPCDLGAGVTVSSRPSGVAAAAEVESVQAVNPNFGVRPLVVLDSAAVSAAQPQIVVGGPFVNSVAASMEQCAGLADASAGDGLVVVEGNKLCVAGFTAADTQAAARELISFLASWDPTAAATE